MTTTDMQLPRLCHYFLFLGLIFLIFSSCAVQASGKLSSQQLHDIGHKIYLNETGGNEKHLIAWNEGEAFASLGIGHFIWFPKDLDSPFTETFPALLGYLKNQGLSLPSWLNDTQDCPWKSKDEFEKAQGSVEMQALRDLLQGSFTHQVNFIKARMQASLSLMLAQVETPHDAARLRHRFEALSKTEQGLYALIDYVNFKGEGISSKERYQGQGWGLKQVLLNIRDDSLLTDSFAQACIEVLERRVQNSPQKAVETRWLPGWRKRCNSYR